MGNDTFIVQGQCPLEGTLVPAGNKNAALPIIAACLLTDQKVVLRNVPQIGDVNTMVEILADIGVDIERMGDHELAICARNVRRTELNPELCHRIRSIMLAGPMLARCGKVRLPHPGGDMIGRRRVDTHFLALGGLGAQVEVGDYHYQMQVKGRLQGGELFLDEASVTATENAIMAACLAKGRTLIHNAACEPHVQELCTFLNSLGAKISGIGTNVLTIEGVDSLGGGSHEINSDHIEVGSFIGLAAVTHSQILIKKAVPEHMRMILLVFKRLGVQVEIKGEDILVPEEQSLEIVPDAHNAIPKIDDAPWPGFPPDLISIAIVVASQAKGTVLIFEKMFESRLFFVDKLIAMGARIVLCDPHRAVVVGPASLHGEELVSPDIRAGMALLIASLCAKGTTVIHNVRQIDRGYERIDERLRALGAKINRV